MRKYQVELTFFFNFEWDNGIEPSLAYTLEGCRAPPATLIPHK